jgi:hypothetical protein
MIAGGDVETSPLPQITSESKVRPDLFTIWAARARKMILKIRVRLAKIPCLRADLKRITAVKTGRHVKAFSGTQLTSKREIKPRFLTLRTDDVI